MTTKTSHCGAALACAAFLLAGEDALRFEAQGSLRRTFGETTHWELTSLTELVSGNQLPAEEVDFTGTASRELELVDALGPVEDGRPTHLTRSFETAEKFVETLGRNFGQHCQTRCTRNGRNLLASPLVHGHGDPHRRVSRVPGNLDCLGAFEVHQDERNLAGSGTDVGDFARRGKSDFQLPA